MARKYHQTRSDRAHERRGMERRHDSDHRRSSHDDRKKYHQTRKDRTDERRGMEGSHRSSHEGYHSKEARAGHRYDESSKHRRRESEGMRKYWHEKEDGRGHAHRDVHHEDKHNSPGRYGSMNHGDGSVSEYGRGSYPRTMDHHRRDPGYDSGRINPIEVAQHQESWDDRAENSMRQHESGSMDYLSDKDEINREDHDRISKYMLPQ